MNPVAADSDLRVVPLDCRLVRRVEDAVDLVLGLAIQDVVMTDAKLVGWGHLSRPELFGRQRVHRVRIDEFRHRRGMARLILDPYSLPGTVPEATETEVVRWIWTKRAEVSEETQRFSRPNVLGQGNRYGRIWNRTIDRVSRLLEVHDVPPAATTLTVTIGPEAAIPASCVRTLIVTHPRGEGDLNPRAQSALD